MTHPEFNKNTFPHWKNLETRFRDLDTLNHVNNAVYGTYYEEARVNFIRQIPAFNQDGEKHLSFVIANIKIDFIKPVLYPSTILVGSGILEIGNTSISSFQALYNNENKQLASVAEVHGVWFDLDEQHPTPVPDVKDLKKFQLDF